VDNREGKNTAKVEFLASVRENWGRFLMYVWGAIVLAENLSEELPTEGGGDRKQA